MANKLVTVFYILPRRLNLIFKVLSSPTSSYQKFLIVLFLDYLIILVLHSLLLVVRAYKYAVTQFCHSFFGVNQFYRLITYLQAPVHFQKFLVC